MPVSESANLAPIANYLENLQPKGIFDMGCGTGLYGCLLRSYLDGRHGRVQQGDWQVTIVGLEGFREYANPLWNAYDNVTIGDISKVYEGITGWNVVLALDCMEHLEKDVAKIILQTLVHQNDCVIVSVPIGNCPQDACFGNELERHRSTWFGVNEFDAFSYQVLHNSVCLVVALRRKD